MAGARPNQAPERRHRWGDSVSERGPGRAAGRPQGTAEKRIRESSQPMSTAKALVKEWHGRRRPSAATPPVDDRAALIRAAYAMELGHGWPAGDQAEAA